MDPDRFAEKLFASFAQWFPGVAARAEDSDAPADIAEFADVEETCHD